MWALLFCSLALGQDDPWGDLLDDAQTLPEEGEPPPAETAAPPIVIEDLDTPERKRPTRSDTPITPQGHRISPVGGGHALALAEDAVLGGDGGTNVTTLSTRVVLGDYTIAVSLPFAAYRTPDGRTTDLGNLFVEGLYALDQGELVHALGIEAHINPGGQPFTWANEAEQLWPGAGANAVYQLRMRLADDTAILARGTAGIHTSQGFDPFHKVYPRFSASAGIDQTVASGVGIVGETTLSYWDVSPWEVAGLVRVDPVSGIRARGGLLLPMFTWLGATPIDRPAGIREITLLLDIQMAI